LEQINVEGDTAQKWTVHRTDHRLFLQWRAGVFGILDNTQAIGLEGVAKQQADARKRHSDGRRSEVFSQAQRQ
jgi:hypothetical protein